MHIIIVGAGVVGLQLAHQLIAQKHDVTLIEHNKEVVQQISNKIDCLIVNKSGNDPETLHSCGVDKADFLICVTHSDEMNVLICNMVSTVEGRPAKIARVRNIHYQSFNSHNHSFNDTLLLNPEIEAAQAIVRSIEEGALGDILVFDNSNIEIRTLRIDAPSTLCNRSLRKIRAEIGSTFLIALIIRGDDHIIPGGLDIVQEGDVIYIAAERDQFKALYQHWGYTPQKARKILLVGGGKVGSLITAHLMHTKHSSFKHVLPMKYSGRPKLVVIEKDKEQAEHIATEFPSALVLNADITDSDLFEEERLDSSQLLITATENEEINLLSATYGKTRGINRAIALVSKSTYTDFANKLGVDVAVSLKQTLVNVILRIVRGKYISGVYSISDGKIEVLELSVHRESRAIGKQIKEITIPPRSLLISVRRQKQIYLPRGELVIRENDKIIVIVAQESVHKIQKLFIGTIG